MRVDNVEAEEATIRLNNEELLILNNALNEVCNGLDIAEFSTRMGAEMNDVEALLNQIGQLIDDMEDKKQ